MRILGNVFSFVMLYLVFMLPTYFLPYLGSNSSTLNAVGIAAGIGLNPAFFFHFCSLIVLIAIAWFRGSFIGKSWLVIFPIIAAFFDLMPGLSVIPLIPTIMHLFSLIMGAMGSQTTDNESNAQFSTQEVYTQTTENDTLHQHSLCAKCGAYVDDTFCEQCGAKQ